LPYRLNKCILRDRKTRLNLHVSFYNDNIMRKYEALIVFNMKGSELPVEELIKNIASEMTSLGAQITDTQNVGRREFAYESDHLKAGQYVTYTFDAEPSAIRPIREHLRINPVVHLQYYKAL
jgi:small subunit ribosomal protein S6